jgi:hypothetical protein
MTDHKGEFTGIVIRARDSKLLGNITIPNFFDIKAYVPVGDMRNNLDNFAHKDRPISF